MESETSSVLTPKKDPSKELSELKFLLSRAQHIAHMGFWVMDLETDRLEWSEETCELFEVEPAEFKNRFELFLNKVLPEDQSKISDAIKRAEKGDGRLEVTYRIRLKDGSIRWLFEQGDIEKDPSGRPLRRIGVVMDITPQKHAEQRLALNENLNRMAATLSSVGGWAYDCETEALYWSDTVKEIHQTPADYSPGVEEAINFYIPEHRTKVKESFESCVTEGVPFDLELMIVSAAGQQLWVRAIGQPVLDMQGRVFRVDGAFQDISAQKEIELELARQAQLLDQASDAIFVRDLDNRVIYLNQKAEQLYECSAKDALGQLIAELIYDQAEPVDEATRTVLEDGQWTGELHHLTKEGKQVIIFGRWTLMHDQAGKPQAILAIDTDITESRKREQQFIQNQRLESVGRLASGIAHDLNNVLAPILISLELLKEQAGNDDAVKLVETLESSANRGANLVRQILSLVRGLEGNPTPIDPRQDGPAPETPSESLVILIVEDEYLLQRLASRVLSSQGHSIHTADEGQQALDILKKLDGKVDLVITDLNMPNMGGEEFYRKAHQIFPELLFVFTSGDRHVPHALSEMPQNRLLPPLHKPYSIHDLKRVVEAIRKP